jgi:hypothetical protein
MSASSSEGLERKVRAIFAEHFGAAAADRLGHAVDDVLLAGVARAFPDLGTDRARDLAFHLSDWRSDGAFLIAVSLAPDRFTPDEIADGVMGFLIHAPNHVAAAAKLGGLPVEDIFGIGAVGDVASSKGSAG